MGRWVGGRRTYQGGEDVLVEGGVVEEAEVAGYLGQGEHVPTEDHHGHQEGGEDLWSGWVGGWVGGGRKEVGREDMRDSSVE